MRQSQQYELDRRRERMRRMAGMGALGVLAIGLVVLGSMAIDWLQDSGTLPIEVVKTQGEFHYLSEEVLQKAVAEAVTGGFFAVDVAAVRDAAESVPWVKSVQVRRVWPDELQLAVTERKPLANWGDDKLVSDAGVVFDPVGVKPEAALPDFSGPEAMAVEVVQRWQDWSARLAALNIQATGVHVDARGSWRIETRSGMQIRLGREQPAQRLQRLAAVYSARFAGRKENIESVDLRYTNGLTVRWAPNTLDRS